MPTQQPFFLPACDWKPPRLADLPSWKSAKRVAVDIETCDPQLTDLGPGFRRGAYAVGVSFAIEDGPSHYLPFRHGSGGNLDEEHVLEYLRDQAKVFEGDLVGAKMDYDLDGLAEDGIVFRRVRRFRDVQVAEPLIDENQYRFNLDAIASNYGLPGKDESVLEKVAAAYGHTTAKEIKSNMWRYPGHYAGVYATRDVTLPLQILRRQERILAEQNLLDVWDLECRVLPGLVKMRRRGVKVNFDRLDELARHLIVEKTKLMAEFSRLTGKRATVDDINKSRVLAKCFEMVGVKLPLTEKSGLPSIAGPVLEGLAHPAAQVLIQAKKYHKMCDFVSSVRRHEVAGRIHPTFNQLKRSKSEDGSGDTAGTIARLSCSDPNLQQQPVRGPIAKPWRKIYEPDDDGEWACCDYAQQEPRWAIDMAERSALSAKRDPWDFNVKEAAVAAAQAFRDDAGTDNHDLTAEAIHPGWSEMPEDTEEARGLKKDVRDQAKIIFLGLCYGMGGGKLCIDLGLPAEERFIDYIGDTILCAGKEGQAIIDNFKARVPYVTELSKRAKAAGKRNGYVKTVLGRRCRFPWLPRKRKYDWIHKALNRIIQGSAADQMKAAMADADEAGFKIQLQVHDELDFTVYDRADAFRLAEVMRTAVDSNVPHKIDVEIGKTWGEIEKVTA